MFVSLKRFMSKTFEYANTLTTGKRGRGKDMLTANVVSRRKQLYISNMDYKAKKSPYMKLNFDYLDCKNKYDNFLDMNIVEYDYPYPDNTDIYISDGGVYFPSQYNNELNKKYGSIPVFMALSRHLGNCNVHANVQYLPRIWDKIREQCDVFIYCRSCKVLGKLVIQRVTVYDNPESCTSAVKPYKYLKPPIFAKSEVKALYRTKNEELKRAFDEKNGEVKGYTLIYFNRSNYDTRLFKSILSKKGVEM